MAVTRVGTVVGALLVAALTASLAQTIVIAVLPVLGPELGASTTAVTWVLTAFMLSSAVATPIAGRLGDMFGHRRVMLACLGCFALGTLVCALAGTLGWMVAGRVLQGVAGGVFPLAFGIVRAALPPARVPGVIALLSAMFGIGGSAGMVASGPLADVAGTRWLFWGLLVLAAVAAAACAALPAARPGGEELPGGGLLSGAVVRLMGRRALVTTNLATLVVGAAMFGVITLIPRFVQTSPAAGYGFGASATEAGLVMVPIALAMLVATPLAPLLGRRFGARLPLQAGAACAAASFALLTVAHDHMWQVHAAGLVVGAGYGLAFASIGNLVVEAVEPHQTGVATGVNTIVRTVGGALGAQIAAALLALGTPGPGAVPAESGYSVAFAAFAALAVVALGTAATVPRRSDVAL
ncbi:MFS transporter [Nonomuraea sp. B19D2]|uniref:MFS transporter n=1 Tax=Nonomuraea sp. B19D2 TaxID=3159561 RepID=UPI0032D9E05E